MTEQEAIYVMRYLAAQYPRPEVPAGTITAYVGQLQLLDYHATKRAVHDLVRTSKWLPTIAEICQKEAEHRMPDLLTVDAAWDEGSRLMAKVGAYRQPAGGNPFVRRTLALLGRWESICQEPVANLRPRFYACYNRLVDEAKTATTLGRELGWMGRGDAPQIEARVHELVAQVVGGREVSVR